MLRARQRAWCLRACCRPVPRTPFSRGGARVGVFSHLRFDADPPPGSVTLEFLALLPAAGSPEPSSSPALWGHHSRTGFAWRAVPVRAALVLSVSGRRRSLPVLRAEAGSPRADGALLRSESAGGRRRVCMTCPPRIVLRDEHVCLRAFGKKCAFPAGHAASGLPRAPDGREVFGYLSHQGPPTGVTRTRRDAAYSSEKWFRFWESNRALFDFVPVV